MEVIRQTQSENKNKVTSQTKEKLFTELQNKSFAESEILISKTLDIQIKQSPQVKHQQDESIRLEITLTKLQWQKMIRMKELLSHSLPHGSWDQVFEYIAEKVIQQKDRTLENAKIAEENKLTELTNKQIGKGKTNISPKTNMDRDSKQILKGTGRARKTITRSVQKEIFFRDKCCQYEDKKTGRKCASTWQLSLDHIQPIWANGVNEANNLRILCANHNREIYRKQSNLKTV